MGERVLVSLAALLAVAGLAWSQEPAGPLPSPSGPSAFPGSLDDDEEGAFGTDPPPPMCKVTPDTSPTPYPGCGPSTWVDAEFLYWWVKNAPLPPLLTTGPGIIPSLNSPGAIGSPGTQSIAGNSPLDMGQFPGGRFTFGTWLNGAPRLGSFNTIGLEGSFFFLGRETNHETFLGGPDQPLLTRPVFDTVSQRETAVIVAAPRLLGGNAGSFTMENSTEMWGAEANAFLPVVGKPGMLVGMLTGFRYLNLEESLNLDQYTSLPPVGLTFFNGLPTLSPLGQTLHVFDDFETRNNFYGGQVGTQAVFRYGRLAVTTLAKMAFGSMQESVDISGSTTLQRPFVPAQTVHAGLLALPSNIGNYSHYQFAWVPEGTLTINYQISTNVAFTLGYTFLYVSSVVRPGQQIDRAVNPAELPTAPPFSDLRGSDVRPAFQFNATDFWAQGVNVGLSFNW
jgi:hypothetical protein